MSVDWHTRGPGAETTHLITHSRCWGTNNMSHNTLHFMGHKQHVSLHTPGLGTQTTHLITHSRSWDRSNTSNYTLQVLGKKLQTQGPVTEITRHITHCSSFVITHLRVLGQKQRIIIHLRSWDRNNASHYTLQVLGHTNNTYQQHTILTMCLFRSIFYTFFLKKPYSNLLLLCGKLETFWRTNKTNCGKTKLKMQNKTLSKTAACI